MKSRGRGFILYSDSNALTLPIDEVIKFETMQSQLKGAIL